MNIMNELNINRKDLAEYIAWSLIITIAAWSIGFGVFIRPAKAANLTLVSDTLSNSNPSSTSNHVIAYTNATSVLAAQTVEIFFDPTTFLFTSLGTVTSTDISWTGTASATVVVACGGGGNKVTLAAGATSSLKFTVCGGSTLSAGTANIAISNNKITNPNVAGSYIIRIAGTQTNAADTMVAIISNVTVTASVNTSLTFSIQGVATGTLINGVTTTLASTATALNFGTLPVTSPVTMGQHLNVTTNALNGFTVTVVENQDLTSLNGASIHLFANGIANAAPIAWSAPSSTLNLPWTYGHIGVTSADSDLNSGEFNGSLFAGNFQSTSSRAIFNATGTSDGVTANIGSSSVAFRIQIGALQAAANDYTNVLTYVATPVF